MRTTRIPFAAAVTCAPAIGLAMMLVLWLATPHASAGEKKTSTDRIWTSPDLAKYAIPSIAMLPPATYDGSAESRKQVEQAVGYALRSSGHRWVSPFLARDFLEKAGGDSLVKALNDKLLKSPRLDSLDAPLISRTMHTRALLTVRVDQMEHMELEANQSGRPTTSVQLRAALVDSTGRLLWTIYSSETAEGSQQDPNANVIGVKESGLNNTAVGATTGAPTYTEVLEKIGARWTQAFPKLAAPDSSAAK